MKTIDGDLLLSNYTKEASAFFVNYRTPAALILAASLQGLLHLTRIHHKQDRSRDKSKKDHIVEGWIVTFCQINILMSFLLSMIVLIITTTAEMNIYRGEFKPLAENTFEFLNKEFHFEFATVRWCFIHSTFALLRGVGCHLLLENNLVQKEKFLQRLIVMTLFMSVMTGCVSYTNDAGTMNPWTNWLYMTLGLIKMVWVDSLFIRKPLRILSLLAFGMSFGLTVVYCVNSVLHHGKERKKTDVVTEVEDKTEKDYEKTKKGKRGEVSEEAKEEIKKEQHIKGQ
jgi:hypothetical protein